MKNNKINSNSVNKSLRVVIINPPTKNEAEKLIKKISRSICSLYSQRLNELEEIKWEKVEIIMILI